MNAAALDEAAARLATALELGIGEPRERARVQVELSHLLYETGHTREADAMLAESLTAATGLGERGVAARALVYRLGHRTGDPSLDGEELLRVTEAAAETLSKLGDVRHLAAARAYLGIALQRLGRRVESVRVLELALVDAEAAGDGATRRRVVNVLCSSMVASPIPVPDAIRRCEELIAASGGDRVLEAAVERTLARLLAMAGRSEEALELLRKSGPILDGLESQASHWVHRWAAAETRELAGDRDGAEQELLAMWRSYREFGHHAVDQRAMQAAYALAVHYCDRGRWDEAEACVAFGADVPVPCPTTPAVFRPAVQARLAARAGRHAEAETLAGRALDCVSQTDDVNLQARVWLAVAEVRRAAGDASRTDAAVAEALRLYEAKGNVAAAASVRAAAT
jgi:tetratricopeptide (TPR) repeat protein